MSQAQSCFPHHTSAMTSLSRQDPNIRQRRSRSRSRPCFPSLTTSLNSRGSIAENRQWRQNTRGVPKKLLNEFLAIGQATTRQVLIVEWREGARDVQCLRIIQMLPSSTQWVTSLLAKVQPLRPTSEPCAQQSLSLRLDKLRAGQAEATGRLVQ